MAFFIALMLDKTNEKLVTRIDDNRTEGLLLLPSTMALNSRLPVLEGKDCRDQTVKGFREK